MTARLAPTRSPDPPRSPAPTRPSRTRRPTLASLATATVVAASALAAAGCGGGGGASSRPATGAAPAGHATAARPAIAPRLRYQPLGSLPAPTQDAAGATLPGGVSVLAGGLSAADRSTDEVWSLSGGRLLRSARLPGPQHDAAAAGLGDAAYVFGGADFNQYDHVLRVDGAGTVTAAGRLPTLASDVAVAANAGTAYVVGGYDGANALTSVVAYRPGARAHVLAHLPVGLRYAAVAVAQGRLIVAGGSTPAGASREIYAVDPASGATRTLGRLPRPLTHAAAGVLGSTVYVIGGRGDAVGTPTAAIEAIDPASGHVRSAGRLPRALSDLTAVSQPGAILLYGGRSASATVAAIGRLSPG